MPRFAWKYYSRKYFKPKQRKAYTMLGLTLLSLSIFGTFAIRPTLATIIRLRRKIKDQEEVCKKLDQKLRDLSLAQTELKKISSDLPAIKKALPAGEDFPGLLETLYLTSEKNGLRLEHIRFDQARKTPCQTANQVLAVKALPFHTQAEGDFPQFLNLLKKIQNMPRLLNPKEIRITSRKGDVTETLSLEAETYFYVNE